MMIVSFAVVIPLVFGLAQIQPAQSGGLCDDVVLQLQSQIKDVLERQFQLENRVQVLTEGTVYRLL